MDSTTRTLGTYSLSSCEAALGGGCWELILFMEGGKANGVSGVDAVVELSRFGG